MSEQPTAQEALAAFLRSLRSDTFDDVNVTQAQLARALSASGALISSWESAGAVPPEDRLRQYARFFCTHRSVEAKPATLIPAEDLNADEERERESLLEKLVRLRADTIERPRTARRDTGMLGGRFWYFPDGQDVTIICTRFSADQMFGADAARFRKDGIDDSFTPVQQYAANPLHPNAVYNLANGDMDALLELVGHIRAENPTVAVRWQSLDTIAPSDELTGHVVLLGSGDALVNPTDRVPNAAEELVRSMALPIRFRDDKKDPEFGLRFDVLIDDDGNAAPDGHRIDELSPRFRRDESSPDRPRVLISGAPILEYDVALLARTTNPLNASATVTMCSGLFSRGTYGAVRAMTDSNLRSRNEEFLSESVDRTNFWMLIQVPVFAGRRTITPDLGRASHRLWTS